MLADIWPATHLQAVETRDVCACQLPVPGCDIHCKPFLRPYVDGNWNSCQYVCFVQSYVRAYENRNLHFGTLAQINTQKLMVRFTSANINTYRSF